MAPVRQSARSGVAEKSAMLPRLSCSQHCLHYLQRRLLLTGLARLGNKGEWIVVMSSSEAHIAGNTLRERTAEDKYGGWPDATLESPGPVRVRSDELL